MPNSHVFWYLPCDSALGVYGLGLFVFGAYSVWG